RLPRGTLPRGLLITSGAAHHEVRDSTLRVFDEFKPCRSSSRHELGFGLRHQWKLGLIDSLHKEHVASDRDHYFASCRQFIGARVRSQKVGTQPDTAVT